MWAVKLIRVAVKNSPVKAQLVQKPTHLGQPKAACMGIVRPLIGKRLKIASKSSCKGSKFTSHHAKPTYINISIFQKYTFLYSCFNYFSTKKPQLRGLVVVVYRLKLVSYYVLV